LSLHPVRGPAGRAFDGGGAAEVGLVSDPRSEDGPAGRARRGRNILLAVALGGFVVIVFIVTLVKLGAHVTLGF
ncbi:MAG: hypothetical protein ABI306_06975, partial [Caulobacteraceae bacterium]